MPKGEQKRKPTHPPRRMTSLQKRIAAVQMIANLTGAAVCTFYFMVLDTGRVAPNFGRYLIAAASMTACLAPLSFWVTSRRLRDIIRAFPALEGGGRPEPGLLAAAQKKSLTAPMDIAALAMAIWCLAALIMGGFRFYQSSPGETASEAALQGLRVLAGVLFSGAATASIIFFHLDNFFRKIRPAFFPDGGLVQADAVRRLKVRSRLRFGFTMVSVAPLLAVTLVVYQRAAIMVNQTPEEALRSLLFLLGFILLVGVSLATLLSHLAASGIANPLADIDRAMARVRRGDLDAQVVVADNDELGVLADSFNRMIEGLRERDRVKETFGRFVSPQIAGAVLERNPSLGGEGAEVTVLFSDIRNYTSICEKLPPDGVIELLNNYFAYMVEAVEGRRGLVYQFVGDGIMAVFGAPVKLPDHATRAVESALDMIGALAEFNAEHRAGQDPLRIGVGINSGEVVAGIIGAAQRMEYRVVGDAVNLAARVEGLNKPLGSEILISESTRRRLSRDFNLIEHGPQKVKGKSKPILVFELKPESQASARPANGSEIGE